MLMDSLAFRYCRMSLAAMRERPEHPGISGLAKRKMLKIQICCDEGEM